MLAFLQPSFPPQVPVKLHVPVCSPFTLNTRTHVWKHPYQRRWRPGAPRADWRAAWGTDSPAQMCFCLKLRVQCLWVPGSTYTHYPPPVWLPGTGSGGCHVHRPRDLCTQGNKSGSPQTFTLSACLSLVIKLGRSWKKAWKKAISVKSERRRTEY